MKNLFEKTWFRYICYHLRWQIASIPLYILMVWFERFGKLPSIFLSQLIGACCFWYVDKFIMTYKKRE